MRLRINVYHTSFVKEQMFERIKYNIFRAVCACTGEDMKCHKHRLQFSGQGALSTLTQYTLHRIGAQCMLCVFVRVHIWLTQAL